MPNDLDEMNSVYNEILGEGPAIEDGDAGKGAGRSDDAYAEEDYSGESGDGIDPRDDSTLNDDDDTNTDDDDNDYLGTDDDGDTDDDDGTDDDGTEEIDERWVKAGRVANLGDDAIAELAESRPEALEALARAQEAAAVRQKPNATQDADETDDTKDGGFKPLEFKFDEDDEEEMGSKALKVIRSLEAKVNELGGRLQDQQEGLGNIHRQSQSEKVRQIDLHFDKLAKEIPELGKTGSLTDKQKQNRIFAFKSASNAMQVYGDLSDEDALTMGARALLGTKTKNQAKNDLIRDLDRNKKRFTARGHSRQRPSKRKSVEERAMEALNRKLDEIQADS
jgi:hypothetical protein